MPTTVSTRKPATCKPQIVSTTPLSEGSKCYGSFTFSDGVTVRQSGGLVCSQHGRRHCVHHKLAHDAIIAKAASQEAATLAAIEAAEAFDADYDAWLDVVDASSPLPTPANVQGPQVAPRAPVSMAQRAAAALPADRTPETFSIFAEVAR